MAVTPDSIWIILVFFLLYLCTASVFWIHKKNFSYIIVSVIMFIPYYLIYRHTFPMLPLDKEAFAVLSDPVISFADSFVFIPFSDVKMLVQYNGSMEYIQSLLWMIVPALTLGIMLPLLFKSARKPWCALLLSLSGMGVPFIIHILIRLLTGATLMLQSITQVLIFAVLFMIGYLIFSLLQKTCGDFIAILHTPRKQQANDNLTFE